MLTFAQKIVQLLRTYEPYFSHLQMDTMLRKCETTTRHYDTIEKQQQYLEALNNILAKKVLYQQFTERLLQTYHDMMFNNLFINRQLLQRYYHKPEKYFYKISVEYHSKRTKTIKTMYCKNDIYYIFYCKNNLNKDVIRLDKRKIVKFTITEIPRLTLKDDLLYQRFVERCNRYIGCDGCYYRFKNFIIQKYCIACVKQSHKKDEFFIKLLKLRLQNRFNSAKLTSYSDCGNIYLLSNNLPLLL